MGRAKDMPREELCMECSMGGATQRSSIVQMTKKGSFNHTFTGCVHHHRERTAAAGF